MALIPLAWGALTQRKRRILALFAPWNSSRSYNRAWVRRVSGRQPICEFDSLWQRGDDRDDDILGELLSFSCGNRREFYRRGCCHEERSYALHSLWDGRRLYVVANSWNGASKRDG